MQELEKILEEIEKEQRGYEADHAWNYAKGLEHAANIIRKHIRDLWAAAVQPGAKWLESMSLQVRLL